MFRAPISKRPPLAAFMLALAAALLLHWAPAHAADKVSVQLMWLHQAQFAGFYMAQDAGIYKKYGLDVDVRSGGPNIDPMALLSQGKCDFAVSWLSAAMVLRAQGAPLTHLAQVVQRSSVLLVTLTKSGVSSMTGLRGRRVGMWGDMMALAPKAMLRGQGVNVEETAQAESIALLLSGAATAISAMRYNEYHMLYQAGVNFDEMVVFDPAEAGLNFPEDGLYCLQDTWRDRPDVCRRFVLATMEGWRMAFAKPDAAMASVMSRVNAQHQATNQCHQRWMLQTMQKQIEPGGQTTPGRLDKADFDRTAQNLLAQGLLNSPAQWEGFAVEAWRQQP